MQPLDELELQHLSLIDNSSSEDDQDRRNGTVYLDSVEVDDGNEVVLSPILVLSRKTERRTQRIRWVDQTEDPQPLHVEYEHPRWVTPLGARRETYGICTKMKFLIAATILLSLFIVLLFFVGRLIFPSIGGSNTNTDGSVNVSAIASALGLLRDLPSPS
jgi:hypothetical protein